MKLLDKTHWYKTISISYSLKWKNRQNTNPRISRTSDNKTMLLSKCAICGIKNKNLLRNQK